MFARVSHGQAVMRAEPNWPRLNFYWLGRGILLLLAVLLTAWVIQRLADPMTLPIQKIRVQGALVHVNEAMLRSTVVDKVQGGYFNLDVEALRKTVEQLPWVKAAAVRRVWPDSVVINVIEQRALATWAGGGLINHQGEIFKPEKDTWPRQLPQFTAPAGMENNITQMYQDLSQQLEVLQLRIVALQLDERRAVRLMLHNDIELVLGREERLARLQRFVRIYHKTLAPHASRIQRIDLRYSNGMAVQWKNTIKQGKASRGG